MHNLAYQGVFPAHQFGQLALPDDFFNISGIEFYGQLSFLKAGLYYSDRITTVSPTYAREIQTLSQGGGLDGLLRHRSHDLSGILNGVDYAVWNPASDALLGTHYSATRLAGKAGLQGSAAKTLRPCAEKRRTAVRRGEPPDRTERPRSAAWRRA